MVEHLIRIIGDKYFEVLKPLQYNFVLTMPLVDRIVPWGCNCDSCNIAISATVWWASKLIDNSDADSKFSGTFAISWLSVLGWKALDSFDSINCLGFGGGEDILMNKT